MIQQHEPLKEQSGPGQGHSKDLSSFNFGKEAFSIPKLLTDLPEVRKTTPQTESITASPISSTMDKAGMGLAALCTAKCLGVPVLAALLPIGGLAAYAHHPVVVWGVAGSALLVAGRQLIYKGLQSGRILSPIAAFAAGTTLLFGAIGHSLPNSSSKAGKESQAAVCTCGCGTHKAPENNSEPASFSSTIKSSAHSNLLIGAIALGFLHLGNFRRNYISSKRSQSPNCEGGDSCQCSSKK